MRALRPISLALVSSLLAACGSSAPSTRTTRPALDDRTRWRGPRAPRAARRHPALGRRTAATIRGAQRVELDDVGHVPQLEAFERTFDALSTFVDPRAR